MYNQVDKIPNFPEIEHRILSYWEQIRAFDQLRQKNQGNPSWSFMDGPITANNPMGVHHAWGRSYKDMFQRYHAMNGRELRYQNGFDCQGLWVEVEVEKALGFTTKAEILEFGIDKFVRRCKERVLQFAARQTEQSRRLGYWMEWDSSETLTKLRDALSEGASEVTIETPRGQTVSGSPEALVGQLGSAEFGGSYFTFSDENNYTIWSFLKKCHEQGSVYRGADVMPWCARCGTGLSQMEVTEGRKITRHTSVFVRFPLLEREKEALLVWTTTPWTLSSNVAAAVNPEMTYVELRHGEWTYYVGKGNLERSRVQQLEAAGLRETHKLQSLSSILKGSASLEIVRELKGSELVGLRYQGPYDHLEAANRSGGLDPFLRDSEGLPSAVECHRVIPWSEVSDAEGTGIVHIAPGCGAEDHRLGTEHGLVAIAPLDDEGHYLDGFGSLSGRRVHDVVDQVLSDLKARGLLVAKEHYPHVYPHCWRCKEELVFRLVDEWFIRMDWRDQIARVVPDVQWIPPDGALRELDWLKNMGDWMISKKRFWGLALPIWRCESCGWFDVIGGPEELKARSVQGWSTFEGHTPHRPFVDAVEIRCDGCGATATRVKDVGNPWLDAGIVPFSTLQYRSDPEYWSKWFPADFVVECFPGQFRNWFYSLLAMGAMLEDQAPFRTLLGHGLVRDARGHEMHKSAGNSVAFDEAADAFGAEVMRYLYASQNPVVNLNFPDLPTQGAHRGKGGIDGEVRSKLLTLWNCYSFFVTYASVDRWIAPQHRKVPEPGMTLAQRTELDRWILSRMNRLIQSAHQAFADCSLHRFMERLEHFEDEFSNWYLRRSRRRFWKSETDSDKESAYQTLYEVLTTLVDLMAPILPFLSEEMYQNLVRSVAPDAPESVHLRDYPQVNESCIDEQLEQQIDAVIRTKNLALSLRNQAKVRARQPLCRLILRPRDPADRAVMEDRHFVEQILEECNLKTIELIADESEVVGLKLKPNFKSLGPRYGTKMKAIAKAIESMPPKELLDSLQEGSFKFSLNTGDAEQAEVEQAEVELNRGDVNVVLDAPEHLCATYEFGAFAALDTQLTEALEQEGTARDFNRQAQDQRKALELEVSDRIRVYYSSSERVQAALKANASFLRSELLADELTYVEDLKDAHQVRIAGESMWLKVERS